jgi:dihydroorotase
MLIATHCEDELTIMVNTENYKTLSYNKLKPEYHHLIRNERACWVSSSMAVGLAKKHNTRLHVLHLTTTDELSLFDNTIPLEQKRITAEVCVHHLWFTANDYAKHGNDIKCNPAIKAPRHREALWAALLDNRLDIIATDHAPHTREEKNQPYVQAPAGLPLVQHSLQMMLQAHANGRISLERIAEKMAHAPAVCFRIKERGFVREGYFADLVLVDLNRPYTITPQNILHRCGWSPLENETMNASITHTIVSGHLAYENGVFNENKMGERLEFVVE